MAQIELLASQAPSGAPILFSILKGNAIIPTAESEVWSGPLMTSNQWTSYLFPTPSFGPGPTYTPNFSVLQESPLIDVDIGDYMRLGISGGTDGGIITVFIDWVSTKAFA